MSENYGIPEQVINNIPILGYVDDSGVTRLSNNSISSNNFDGFINKTGASVAVSDVTAGNSIGIVESGSISFYPIISIFREDPDLETGSYTGYHEIQYLVNDELLTASYSASNTIVQVLQEDWTNKYLGTGGWIITQEGNAIFSNVAIRGRIEATEGYIGGEYIGWEISSNLLSNRNIGFYAPENPLETDIGIFSGSAFQHRDTAPFRINYGGQMFATGASISGALTATTLDVGGANGIIYNGSAVTIGASVTINAPVTVNSLQVGASPTLLRIADDVQGTNDGIYINANNYWYSDGQFSVGGSANNAVWSGSTLTITGAINATTITSSVGNIAGFILSDNQLGTASVIVSSSGGLRLGNPVVFSVDQFGNLVATSASITGNITANSGTFTGSITAQHITASIGEIAGFTLSKSQLSTASVIVSSSGGFRLGNPTVFSVDQFGNLVATSASITGDINATSGSFSGKITATTGTIGGWELGSTTLTGTSASLDSAGKVVVGSNQNVAAMSGTDTNRIWAGSAVSTNAPFRVSAIGGLVATSASIIGDVTAQSGKFTGGVTIETGGSLTAGTGAQNVSIDSTGLYGYNPQGLLAFKIPTDGTDPLIAQFKILESGLVSNTSETGANLIVGDVSGTGSAASVQSGIVIRGYRSLNASVAIYTVQGGSATTYTEGNGIYLDETGKFKIKGATGSIRFDGDDLYISGNVNARSGNFTGSIQAQHITASIGNIGGWNLSASALTGNSASLDAKGSLTLGSGQTVVALSSTDTNRIWAGSAVSTTAPFRVSGTGFLTATGASITGDITANSGQFTGSVNAQNITASVGSLGGWQLTASSIIGGTAGASVILESNGTIRLTRFGLLNLSANRPTYSIWVGNDPLTSPFSLTYTGILKAVDPVFDSASIISASIGDSLINGTNVGIGSGNNTNFRVGFGALQSNTSGEDNIAIGASALYSNTVSQNIAIGKNALKASTTGSRNIAIGVDALASLSNNIDVVSINYDGAVSNYNVYIANGNNDLGLRIDQNLNTTLYGNLTVDTNTLFVDATNNEVGIGTVTPASALHVAGISGVLIDAGLNVDGGTLFVDSPNNRVGIGTTSPTNPLTVIGTASISGNTTMGGTASISSTLRVGGDAVLVGNASANSTLYVGTTASIVSNLAVGGTFRSVGAASALSSLYIGGAASALSSFYVGTTASIVSNLAVGGTFRSVGAASAISSLYVGTTASIVSNLAVGGTINGSGNVTISNSSNFAPQLILENTNSLDNAAYFLFRKNFGASASATSGMDLGTIMFQGPSIAGTATNSAYITSESAGQSVAGGIPSSLQFYTGNSAGTSTLAAILTSTQRLGIATSTPASALHVVGGAYVTGAASFGGTITGTSTTQASGDDSTSLATTAFVSRMVKYNGAPSPNTSSVAGFFVLAVNPGNSINGFVATSRGTAPRLIVAALDTGINGAASPGYVRGYVETNAGVAVALGNSVPLSYIAW